MPLNSCRELALHCKIMSTFSKRSRFESAVISFINILYFLQAKSVAVKFYIIKFLKNDDNPRFTLIVKQYIR